MTQCKIIIYLYNRLFDPLIQGNFWLYIDDLLKEKEYNLVFHVVTYEDNRFPLTPEQELQVIKWKQQGLAWTALRWHPGIGMKQKVADILAGFRVVTRLRVCGYQRIISLGSVAGTFAYLYASLLNQRLFLYQYEPHSEYAVDNGMWLADSVQTRISRILERRAARFATVITSGTCFMEERVKQVWQSRTIFIKLPTVANDRKFVFDSSLRAEVREQLGLSEEQNVLFYPGKFEGLYYGDETTWMFRWLLDEDPKLFFLIVTPHNDSEVIARFDRAGVPSKNYAICHSGYADIDRYFFAADFAVIAVPPGPSKKFISNIKVGEYLLAGLPYLITRGVSEDYLFAEENDVGVVVNDFSESEIRIAWPKILKYLKKDPEVRRTHCRKKGLSYRGFDILNPKFRRAIDILVGERRT